MSFCSMKLKLFPLDESLSFLIYRVHTQGAASLRKAFLSAGVDLMPEQWAIMARLNVEEGMNQSRLGQKTFKDRHNINRIINILEKRGLIERLPDDLDNRANRLYLTMSGRTLLEQSTPVVQKHFKQRFSGLSANDLTIFRRILEDIINNIEKIDAVGKSDLKKQLQQTPLGKREQKKSGKTL